jgi:hypothetical protein
LGRYLVDRNIEFLGLLRNHLDASVPEYMVPSAFIRLDALPLTPNGKLNHKALPAPDDVHVRRSYAAPEGEIETTLAETGAELLGFFVLGGDLLLAVRLFGRCSTKAAG